MTARLRKDRGPYREAITPNGGGGRDMIESPDKHLKYEV